MSDTLRTQTTATFTRETPSETLRLFDQALSQIPTSFHHGEVEYATSAADKEIATDVNVFSFQSNEAVSLKIGATNATPLTAMRSFSYNGAATSFYITNPSSVEKVKVTFIAATLQS